MRAVKLSGVAVIICLAILLVQLAVHHNESFPRAATPAGVSTPPVQAGPKSTPDQLAKAQKCRAILHKSSILKRYEWSGSIAVVTVAPAFYLSDYDTKRALNGLVVCVASEGRMDETIDYVDYHDWRTNRSVAEWSPASGLEVKN